MPGPGVAAEPLPGTPGVLPALLDVLLLYILRAWYDEQAEHATTGWGAALRDPAVAASPRAIHREPARPWTVRALATEAGLSRSAFAQRFTSTVGSPPLGYLTWWRMTSAARMLRDTDLLLRSVAEQTGYTSGYACAKAFKREFGAAPGRASPPAPGGRCRPAGPGDVPGLLRTARTASRPVTCVRVVGRQRLRNGPRTAMSSAGASGR
ncbi:AraC family transcriptional regulator [Streptomyces sp. H10-C2]|uniref:helix-turn-helix domain-containing protein n=1 Tax=unclassified Streptomyces TaxID=2593676 RepID=UPI0024B89F1C|nr:MULTISPECIES: AraC family transcriptional regulator [unclassified Streptomyces]MDJ0347258.1 AraC family transcriptional regulator [Streptomyces sp. PH10-H1]MDJ0375500.1 AraC family transcriptional regulator [Streptomyces sp. H10-C2]